MHQDDIRSEEQKVGIIQNDSKNDPPYGATATKPVWVE